MTIYYIAVSSWDGRAYTFDFIIPFLSKEKRNKCFEEMIASKQYGNADYNLVKGEENVSEIQNNPEGLEEAATEFANQDCVTFISRKKGFIAGVEWMKDKMLEGAVEFECIGKKIKMTVKELIDYYIDTECCEVAEECGF